MLDLVFYTDNTLKAEPYTTSEIIANNTNNSRIAVRRLIEKHINTAKKYGKNMMKKPFKKVIKNG